MESHSLYNFEALLPPGITNTAHNCYASSVIQCLDLLNHFLILSMVEEINEEHRILEQCRKSGKTN